MSTNDLASVGRKLSDGLGEVAEVLLARLGPHRAFKTAEPLRVTLVQFGDFAEAFWRFANGGAETYYAQKYTFDFIASLAARIDIEAITLVSCGSGVFPLRFFPTASERLVLSFIRKGSGRVIVSFLRP